MIHDAQSHGGLAVAERFPVAEPIDTLTRGEVLADLEEEFTLDVRVLVTLAPVGKVDCPTDDGCGNTCSGNSSACNSAMNAL